MNWPPPTKQQIYRSIAKRLEEHKMQSGLLAAEAMEDAAGALRDAADEMDRMIEAMKMAENQLLRLGSDGFASGIDEWVGK